VTTSHDSASFPALWLSALLLAAAPVSAAEVAGQGPGPEATAVTPDTHIPADLQALEATIARLESEHGAYSPALPEQLLSLGQALQAAGRHRDAATVLRRGAHLARVSSGLYAGTQLPLLEAEIASLMALADYPAVDQRQTWLHRVQQRALSAGPARARALVRHADWQRLAYLYGIDEEPAHRLANMWELNRQALNELLESEGDRSPRLLMPLRGMLQTQYLISDLQWQGGPGLYDAYQLVDRGPGAQRSAYRRDSFQQGLSLLRAMHELQVGQSGAGAPASVRTLVQLGDWQQWHGEHQEALKTWRRAFAELAGSDTAQARRELDELFSAPVPLPDLPGVSLFAPVPKSPEGDILLEFDVGADGRVTDLLRKDDNSEVSGVAHKLMRKLRRTPFRPRFDPEVGQPVATNNMLWAYDSKQW
jgi:tetratricopeptide (TPR) repeat protein